MKLEVGKVYYLEGFGEESIIITLDNKTRFPDRSLRAIRFTLEADSGLGRLTNGIELTDAGIFNSWDEITDKNKIMVLQKRAIKSAFELRIRFGT